MRCEVLGFKDVKTARYATVRLVDLPDMIGEVPMAKDSHVERGQIVDLQIKPRVYAGRLDFSAMVL